MAYDFNINYLVPILEVCTSPLSLKKNPGYRLLYMRLEQKGTGQILFVRWREEEHRDLLGVDKTGHLLFWKKESVKSSWAMHTKPYNSTFPTLIMSDWWHLLIYRPYSFTLLLFYSSTLLLFYSFSIELMTLPLLAPRSTDWASGPLDITTHQINSFYTINACKLLKKRN